MNALSLVPSLAFGLAAAGALFASSRHSPAWLRATRRRHLLWLAVFLLLMLAVWLAATVLGQWAGLFFALVALMSGCALLPYLAAWAGLKRRISG